MCVVQLIIFHSSILTQFNLALFRSAVTADYPQNEREPERPARASPHPPRPPPPRPSPPPHSSAATADFLNLSSGSQEQEPPKVEKKLKSEESFDFFGMMAKPDDAFGDFLGGTGVAAVDNPQVNNCILF